jgi:hypothetical protein
MASTAGYRNVSYELIAEFVVLGLLDVPTQVTSKVANESIIVDEWPDSQKDLFLQLLIYKSSVVNVTALASLPVAAWLYWDDDHVPLRQAKIALHTFWKPDPQLMDSQRTTNQAWTIVNVVLGEQGSKVTRRQLHHQLVRILNLQEYSEATIRALLDDVVQQLPRSRVGRPELGVEVVHDMVCNFALALAHYDEFSDDDFNATRERQRQEVLSHVRDRSKISEDPTPEDWFNQIDYTFLIHNACRDLIMGLGHTFALSQRSEPRAQPTTTQWRGLSVELFGAND